MLNDKRLRMAVGIGVVEWVLIGALILLQGQLPLVISILMFATALQMWALFGPQGKPTEFHTAQRLFMEGDLEAAVAKLEAMQNPDVQSRTLLGNTYRQMGRLSDSETLLQAVVDDHPKDAFPIYGLGRTLLAKGDFAAAQHMISHALEHKGRKVILTELALAAYLNGNMQVAQESARRASRILQLEQHRSLMVNYILHQVADDPKALPYLQRMQAGVAYWQAEAERFADTPYGERLQQELVQMETLLGKEALLDK